MDIEFSAQPATTSHEVPGEPGKILFATIAAGGSHVSSAEALRESLERLYPGRFASQVREPMRDYGFHELDTRHKEGWREALRRPWTIVWGQRLIDALPATTVAFHRRLLRDFARRAALELNRQRPRLVVVNHGWLTIALTMAQRRYGLEVPVLTFETSTLNANALWAEPQAERFVVASDTSKSRLVRFGIAPERIDVVGYPVREAFLRPPSKSAARRLLGLEDTFTCLLTLGGEGVGGTPEHVLGALQAERDLQVVVITGRNSHLRSRLEGFRERLPRLRVLGFVDDMAHYLAASDVIIGKTGPATVFETLAVGRPLLAPTRFGIAENKMLRLLEENGLGHFTSSAAELLTAVRAYRDEPGRLVEIEQRARALDFPGMAERLARYVAHYAETGRVADDACGRGLLLTPKVE